MLVTLTKNVKFTEPTSPNTSLTLFEDGVSSAALNVFQIYKYVALYILMHLATAISHHMLAEQTPNLSHTSGQQQLNMDLYTSLWSLYLA